MLFGYFFLNQTSGYHAVFCSSTVFWPHCGFLATSGSVVTAGAGVRHRLTWSQAVHLRTRVKLQPQLWGWHGVMGMITKTGFSSSCCPVNRRGDVFCLPFSRSTRAWEYHQVHSRQFLVFDCSRAKRRSLFELISQMKYFYCLFDRHQLTCDTS